MLAILGSSKFSLNQPSNDNASRSELDIGRGSDTPCSRGPTRFRGCLGAPWTLASDKRRLPLGAGTSDSVDATVNSDSKRSSWNDEAGEGNPTKAEGDTSSLARYIQ